MSKFKSSFLLHEKEQALTVMLDLGLSSVELVAAGRIPMIRSSSSKVEPAPAAAVEGLEVFLTLYCK